MCPFFKFQFTVFYKQWNKVKITGTLCDGEQLMDLCLQTCNYMHPYQIFPWADILMSSTLWVLLTATWCRTERELKGRASAVIKDSVYWTVNLPPPHTAQTVKNSSERLHGQREHRHSNELGANFLQGSTTISFSKPRRRNTIQDLRPTCNVYSGNYLW